jgi:hypothetical protein
VVSKHGREWLIGIEINEAAYKYRVVYLDAVPWESWDGRMSGKRLIDGDVPNQVAYRRMRARRKHAPAPATRSTPARGEADHR